MRSVAHPIMMYPWLKGVNTESIPGTQDPRALEFAKNMVLNNRGSMKKKPGVEKLEFTGKKSGNLQNAVQFFATSGAGQRSEIIRVLDGRIEVVRDDNTTDLGVEVSDTDIVTFTRFANVLIMHFENTRPKKYLIGGTTLSNLTLLSDAHHNSPPTFSVSHDSRLWYSGRPSQPHRIFASAINNIDDYSLDGGGFSIRVNDGDGDPQGITGISPTFKGDIFAFKRNSIYRISRGQYGYAVDQLTNEVGCVHHNTIVAAQNDVFFVSTWGIHSLVNTDKFGAVEENVISYPIFQSFQDNVNWSAARLMKATYDKHTNCYLLSYPSAGSAVNDRVMGFNVLTKEFIGDWEVEYSVLTRYQQLGQDTTLVGSGDQGLGLLNKRIFTEFGEKIPMKMTTGPILPLKKPHAIASFVKAWVLAKPSLSSVEFTFSYYINGDLIGSKVMDTSTDGAKFEGTDSGIIDEMIIGSDIIGDAKDNFVLMEIELNGEGSNIQFDIDHTPPDDDINQDLEIYGIVFEVQDREDSDEKQAT